MTHCELILQGISDGDTIGGPFAMASLVAKTLSNDPFNMDALDQAYMDYYESGSFDSGPTFEKVHELMTRGYSRVNAVKEVHKLFKGMTAGCNPMHRFMVVAGSSVEYEDLDVLARKEAGLTHFDPSAGLYSGILVRIVRRLLEGQGLELAHKKVSSELALREREKLMVKISNSGVASDVLSTALYFAEDVDNGLVRALEFAGSNNYCPPIVGVLVAAQRLNRGRFS